MNQAFNRAIGLVRLIKAQQTRKPVLTGIGLQHNLDGSRFIFLQHEWRWEINIFNLAGRACIYLSCGIKQHCDVTCARSHHSVIDEVVFQKGQLLSVEFTLENRRRHGRQGESLPKQGLRCSCLDFAARISSRRFKPVRRVLKWVGRQRQTSALVALIEAFPVDARAQGQLCQAMENSIPVRTALL